MTFLARVGFTSLKPRKKIFSNVYMFKIQVEKEIGEKLLMLRTNKRGEFHLNHFKNFTKNME